MSEKEVRELIKKEIAPIIIQFDTYLNTLNQKLEELTSEIEFIKKNKKNTFK